MNKKLIRLTESDLHSIIKESVHNILSENKTLYINIENLKDKKISYVIMQSSVNDSNYVFTADKYQNSTEKELKQSKEKIILNLLEFLFANWLNLSYENILIIILA